MPLIVHIGFHKTGTTSVQTFLHNNRDVLETRGVVVPPGLSSWMGHPDFAWAFDRSNYPWQDKAYDFESIDDHYRSYLERSRDCKVILSSEEFCRLEFNIKYISALAKYLEPYDPIFVAIIRNPLDFLTSRYRHEVQMGAEKRSFRKFVADFDNIYSANFYHRVYIWEQIFGDRVIVRQYNDIVNYDHDICKMFAAICDIDISELQLPPREEELKLNFTLLDAAREVGKLPPESQCKYYDALFEISNAIDNAEISTLTEGLSLSDDIICMLNSIHMERIVTSRSLQDFLTSPNNTDSDLDHCAVEKS